jgi:CBS domain-containing protein
MRITDIPEYHDRKELLTVTKTTTLVETAKKLKKQNCGAAIVVDKNGKVDGIITERDFLMKVVAEDKDFKKLKVQDIMTANVKTAKVTDDVTDCMRRMTQGHFRHLPVVNDDGKAVGMISLGDFVAVTWHQVFHQLKTQTKASFMSNTQLWILFIVLLAFIILLLQMFVFRYT